MTDRTARRFGRRLPYAVVLGCMPVLTLAYLGCGDDDAPPGDTRVTVDPGGTWGAEVVVSVVGRGRVFTDVRGVDCPSGSCFAKLVFPSNTADGATGGIKLNASPTSGVKFLGWSFEPASLGAAGRGPGNCNPVTRAATIPIVNASDLSITLPFGETEGTAPAGQEGPCAAFRKVPLAYRVIARFESELPPFDAGFDAGMDETIFEAPDLGATNGRDVGFTSSSTLFWRYDAAGSTHVAIGTGASSSFAPQTATRVATIQNSGAFRVHPRGVVYTDGADIYAIRSSSTTATRVGDQNLGTCRGFTIDTGGNVYCRTATSIVRWLFSGLTYSAPFVLYGGGLPAGDDIAIESSSGPIYLDTGTGISSVPAAGNDGGVATVTTLITGRSGVGDFRLGTFGFGWSELDTGVYTTSSRSALAPVNESTTNAGTIVGLQPEQSGFVALGTTGIYLVPAAGTSTAFRGGQFTGAAASSSYVVWNVASDGRVHRARRF